MYKSCIWISSTCMHAVVMRETNRMKCFFSFAWLQDTCTYCSKLHFPLRNIFCVPQWWQLIWLDNKNYKVCRLNNLFNKACNTVHVPDHECVFQFLVLVEFMYCSSIIFFFYESFQLKPVIKGKEIILWNLFQHLFSFFDFDDKTRI